MKSYLGLVFILLSLFITTQAAERLPEEVERARCKGYIQLISLKTDRLVNFIVTGSSYGEFYDQCDSLVRELIELGYRTELIVDKNNVSELNKEIERTCTRKASSVCR